MAVIVVVLLGDLLHGLATGQTQFADIGTLVWDGLMWGLVIGLTSTGLPMMYSILNFANLSYGDHIAAGAFSGWATTYLIAGLGRADIGAPLLVGTGGSVYSGMSGIGMFSTSLAVVTGIVVPGGFTIVLSLAVDRTIFKPIRNEDGIALLITSVSAAFALRYLMQLVFDSDVRGMTAQPLLLSLDFIGGMAFISAYDITLLAVASVLMLGVHMLLQRTKFGKVMCAMTDNKDLALTTGISTERVIRATRIIGGGSIGIAGYMFILWKGTLGFNDRWLLLLLTFAAVILGGIGSIYGAITDGLVIGLTMSVLALWISSAFSRAAAFVVMIVILLVEPSGLFSGRVTA